MGLNSRLSVTFFVLLGLYALAPSLMADTPTQATPKDLPIFKDAITEPVTEDYLITKIDRRAKLYQSQDGKDLIMDNGLIRRVWRLTPNAACYRFDNLMTGEAILRAVRPEASSPSMAVSTKSAVWSASRIMLLCCPSGSTRCNRRQAA